LLKEIFKYFLYLGFAGFGGPLAVIEMMRRELVMEKKWLSLEDFESVLGYAQIAPGPYAYQVAMYIGFKKAGYSGAILAAFLLVFPSFLLLLTFSYFYAQYKDITYVQYALYGLSPVIAALIFQSGFNLSKSIFKKDIFLYLLFFVSIAMTIFIRVQIIYIIITSALISVIFYTLTNRKKIFGFVFIPVIMLFSQFIRDFSVKLSELAFLFLKIGALTYGSGFVIVGVLRQEVVTNLQWLSPQEFIDGLAFGQITPGPVVITATFIGYMVKGFAGSIVATFAIFLPSTLIVLSLAKNIDRVKNNFYVKSLIRGANAAAIGAILATAYFIARDSIIDIYTLGFFISGLMVLFISKIKPVLILFGFAVFGIILRMITG